MMALHVLLQVTAAATVVAAAGTPTQQAELMLKKLTLGEKVTMLHGSGGGYVGNVPEIVNSKSGVKIPPLNLNDGPQGFRGGGSTCWPSTLAVGATWDRNLSAAWGTAMGREFYDKGSNVQLGPGLCLARVPNNGRNFEYISGEDPYLGWAMAKPLVEGIQSNHIIANAKHWVMNSQESNRHGDTAVVDERTRFEMYYPPFEGALEGGVGSVMGSYNLIQTVTALGNTTGNWSCENNDTLATDLKARLGFKGWVMSDWGATHSTSIMRGLDQEMPGGEHMGSALLKAVQSGAIPEAAVDDSVRRILTAMYQQGLFEPEHYAQWTNKSAITADVTSAEHSRLARELAAAGAVLLKTEGAALPVDLSKVRSILVVGSNGGPAVTIHGGGSGAVGPTYVVSPYDGIVERFIRGAKSLPTKPRCSFAPSDTQIIGSTVKPLGMAAAASPAECCARCFKSDSCNFFSFSAGSLSMKSAADVKVQGGASVMTDSTKELYIRSGSPRGHSSVALLTPLTPGARINGLSFSYRYLSGYHNPKKKNQVGATFSVRIGGTLAYTSPHLTDYDYNNNRTNYSVPVPVHASGLNVMVPASGSDSNSIMIEFDNNDLNVQLLLPIQFKISCAGDAPCTSSCRLLSAATGLQSDRGVTSGACGKAPLPVADATGKVSTNVTFYGGSDPAQIATLAAAADLTVVFTGTSSEEGGDRRSLSLPADQDAAVVAASNAAPGRTVAVVFTPGAVLLPWANSSNVGAVLAMFLPGLEVGHAVADVLFGDVSPTGRLPITFPNIENEIGFTAAQYHFDGRWTDRAISVYTEKLLVGYRWYDAQTPMQVEFSTGFPFGHGLSYTSFAYTALKISSNHATVTCVVTNTGSFAGAEIAQLYLGFPKVAGEPPRQLKGFVKTAVLAPGAHAIVKFALRGRDLSIWDVAAHTWAQQPGTFTLGVGASSRDIRLTGSFTST